MAEFKRHFDENFFRTHKKDLIKLVNVINEFDGQVDFQIRTDNKFTVYHLGQTIGCVEPSAKKFRITTTESFKAYDKLSDKAKNELGKSADDSVSVFKFKDFSTCFTKTFIKEMCAKIKERNFQAERQFEQKILADNMYNPEFFIIDSEVIVPDCGRKRLDLLALKKAASEYVLVLLELKLISNREAENGDVINQINFYHDAFNKNLKAIADSYEINYKQKRELGVYGENFPKEIKISHEKVEKAIIISDGKIKAEKLKSDIKDKHKYNFDGEVIITTFDIAKNFIK